MASLSLVKKCPDRALKLDRVDSGSVNNEVVKTRYVGVKINAMSGVCGQVEA